MSNRYVTDILLANLSYHFIMIHNMCYNNKFNKCIKVFYIFNSISLLFIVNRDHLVRLDRLEVMVLLVKR